MAWPLYFRITCGQSVWLATGWRAGVVDLAFLTVLFLVARLLYGAVLFFVRGGADED